jgi:hypothetical protein
MSFNRKRQTEAMIRATERRQREDEAPRLKHEVSGLTELCMEIEERVGASSSVAARYVRRVVIDSAPALFEIRCTEERCNDGGHDLTSAIMRALRNSATEFRGEDVCYGRLGSSASDCARVLHYVGRAKYG